MAVKADDRGIGNFLRLLEALVKTGNIPDEMKIIPGSVIDLLSFSFRNAGFDFPDCSFVRSKIDGQPGLGKKERRVFMFFVAG